MKTNKNTKHYPIPSLREDLRLRACDLAGRLGRSVGRLTSCDALPCTEYGEEVSAEHRLAEELFYIQHCRTALEQCIAGKNTILRYRRSDGSTTRTAFRREGVNRVRVTGGAW